MITLTINPTQICEATKIELADYNINQGLEFSKQSLGEEWPWLSVVDERNQNPWLCNEESEFHQDWCLSITIEKIQVAHYFSHNCPVNYNYTTQ